MLAHWRPQRVKSIIACPYRGVTHKSDPINMQLHTQVSHSGGSWPYTSAGLGRVERSAMASSLNRFVEEHRPIQIAFWLIVLAVLSELSSTLARALIHSRYNLLSDREFFRYGEFS